MRHPSLEELLDVRDGEGTPEAAAHVEACPDCAAEVESLRETASMLRELPQLAPEHDQWPAIRDSLEGEERGWLGKAVVGTALALAATLVILVLLPGTVPPGGDGPAGLAGAGRQTPVSDAEIARLVEESQRLEGLLRRVGTQSRVTDGWSAHTVADLQDRIALVDAQLAADGGVRVTPRMRARLWRVRVDLMNELVRAKADRPQYVEF